MFILETLGVSRSLAEPGASASKQELLWWTTKMLSPRAFDVYSPPTTVEVPTKIQQARWGRWVS